MKPTHVRRNRRKPAASKESPVFRKEGQKENTFFGEATQTAFFQPAPVVQRKCEDCEKEEKQVKRLPEKKEEEEKKVQKMEEKKEEDKKVNRKETAAPAGQVSTGSYLNNLSGKGHALPPHAQQFFGGRMGYDFSNVKIHTGQEAAQSARQLNAQAYTYQDHIVFNEGKYNTEAADGKKLLAHELTHVMQQDKSKTGNQVDRQVNITAPYPVKDDFEPGDRFRKQSRALGLTESLLNKTVQLPSLGAGNFEKALEKPELDERSLAVIPRPNLRDASLAPVWANKLELSYGSWGKHVQLVQQALIAWGRGMDEPQELLSKYKDDKDYRGETESTVLYFQKMHPGLAQDGIVGDLTLAALQDEMDKLHGAVFSIKQVRTNDFTGTIHIPPPSTAWPSFVTGTDTFFNDSVEPLHQAQLAGHFNKCNVNQVTLTFKDANGVPAATLQHERVHEKDQLKTIRNRLVGWDTDLTTSQSLNFKFRAADMAEAKVKLYVLLGISDPATLSKEIIGEFSADNQKFHATASHITTGLDLPSCTQVVFTLSK